MWRQRDCVGLAPSESARPLCHLAFEDAPPVRYQVRPPQGSQQNRKGEPRLAIPSLLLERQAFSDAFVVG